MLINAYPYRRIEKYHSLDKILHQLQIALLMMFAAKLINWSKICLVLRSQRMRGS
jgi:hypothetical protein